jgi:hypothetical protein
MTLAAGLRLILNRPKVFAVRLIELVAFPQRIGFTRTLPRWVSTMKSMLWKCRDTARYTVENLFGPLHVTTVLNLRIRGSVEQTLETSHGCLQLHCRPEEAEFVSNLGLTAIRQSNVRFLMGTLSRRLFISLILPCGATNA